MDRNSCVKRSLIAVFVVLTMILSGTFVVVSNNVIESNTKTVDNKDLPQQVDKKDGSQSGTDTQDNEKPSAGGNDNRATHSDETRTHVNDNKSNTPESQQPNQPNTKGGGGLPPYNGNVPIPQPRYPHYLHRVLASDSGNDASITGNGGLPNGGVPIPPPRPPRQIHGPKAFDPASEIMQQDDSTNIVSQDQDNVIESSAGNNPVPTLISYTECMVNGGFETGDYSGWVTGGAMAPPNGWLPMTNPPNVNSGVWAAAQGFPGGQLGPGNYYMYQDVAIPIWGSSASLSFSDACLVNPMGQWISTPPTINGMPPYYEVSIRDSVTNAVLAMVFQSQPGGVTPGTWGIFPTPFQPRVFDMTPFIGMTVRVQVLVSVMTAPGVCMCFDDFSVRLTGDWKVSGTQTIKYKTINVYGNLIVPSDASLNLISCDIYVYGSFTVAGRLRVNDTYFDILNGFYCAGFSAISKSYFDPPFIVVSGTSYFNETSVVCEQATIVRIAGTMYLQSSEWWAMDSGWNVWIYVEGKLYSNRNSSSTTNSIFTTDNSNYGFNVNKTGAFYMYDSNMYYCGIDITSYRRAGCYINSNKTDFARDYFEYNIIDLVFHQANVTVRDSDFNNYYACNIWVSPDTDRTFVDWRASIINNSFYMESYSSNDISIYFGTLDGSDGYFARAVANPIVFNYDINITNNKFTIYGDGYDYTGAIILLPIFLADQSNINAKGKVYVADNKIAASWVQSGIYIEETVKVHSRTNGEGSGLDGKLAVSTRIFNNTLQLSYVVQGIFSFRGLNNDFIGFKGGATVSGSVNIEQNDLDCSGYLYSAISVDNNCVSRYQNGTWNTQTTVYNNTVDFSGPLYGYCIDIYDEAFLGSWSYPWTNNWCRYTNTNWIQKNNLSLDLSIAMDTSGIYVSGNCGPYSGKIWFDSTNYITDNNISMYGSYFVAGIEADFGFTYDDGDFGAVFANCNANIDDNEVNYVDSNSEYGIYSNIWLFQSTNYKDQLFYLNESRSITGNRIIFLSDGYFAPEGIGCYLNLNYYNGGKNNTAYVKSTKHIDSNRIYDWTYTTWNSESHLIDVENSLTPYTGNITFTETTTISSNKLDTTSFWFWWDSGYLYGIYYQLYFNYMSYYWQHANINSTVTIDANRIFFQSGGYNPIYCYDYVYPVYGNGTFEFHRFITANNIYINKHRITDGIYCDSYLFSGQMPFLTTKYIYTLNVDRNRIQNDHQITGNVIYVSESLYAYNSFMPSDIRTSISGNKIIGNTWVQYGIYFSDSMSIWNSDSKPVVNFKHNINNNVIWFGVDGTYQAISIYSQLYQANDYSNDIAYLNQTGTANGNAIVINSDSNTRLPIMYIPQLNMNGGSDYNSIHMNMNEKLNYNNITVNASYVANFIDIEQSFNPYRSILFTNVSLEVSYNTLVANSGMDEGIDYGLYMNNGYDGYFWVVSNSIAMVYNNLQISGSLFKDIDVDVIITTFWAKTTYTGNVNVNHNSIYNGEYLNDSGISYKPRFRGPGDPINHIAMTVTDTVNINYNTLHFQNSAYYGIALRCTPAPYWANTIISLTYSVSHNMLYFGGFAYVQNGIYVETNLDQVYSMVQRTQLTYIYNIDYNRLEYTNSLPGQNGIGIYVNEGFYIQGFLIAQVTTSISNNKVFTKWYMDAGICYELTASPQNDQTIYIMTSKYDIDSNAILQNFDYAMQYGIDVEPWIYSTRQDCLFYYNQTGSVDSNSVVFNFPNDYYDADSVFMIYYGTYIGPDFSMGYNNTYRVKGIQSASHNTLIFNTTSYWEVPLFDFVIIMYPSSSTLIADFTSTVSNNNVIFNDYNDYNYYPLINVMIYLRQDYASTPKRFISKVTSNTAVDSNMVVMQKGTTCGINLANICASHLDKAIMNTDDSMSSNIVYWGTDYKSVAMNYFAQSYPGDIGDMGNSLVNASVIISANRLYGNWGIGIFINIDSSSQGNIEVSRMNLGLTVADNKIWNAEYAMIFTTDHGNTINTQGFINALTVIADFSSNWIFNSLSDSIVLFSEVPNSYGYVYSNYTIGISDNYLYPKLGYGIIEYFYVYNNDSNAITTNMNLKFDYTGNYLYGNGTATNGIYTQFDTDTLYQSSVSQNVDLLYSGNSVIGFDEYGIYIDGYADSQISNSNYWALITITATLEKNTIEYNNYGIYARAFVDSDYLSSIAVTYLNITLINNPSIANNAYGVFIVSDFYSAIYHNIASINAVISDNNIHDNTVTGIYTSNDGMFLQGTISNNWFWRNGNGLDIYYAYPLNIIDNTFHNNTNSAMMLWSCHDVAIDHNRIINNANGIYLYNCRSTRIVNGNDIVYNFWNGIILDQSTFAYIEDNRIAWNLNFGVFCWNNSRSEFVVKTNVYCAWNDLVLYGNMTIYGTLVLHDLDIYIGGHRHNEDGVYVRPTGTLTADNALFSSGYWDDYAYKFEVYGKMTLTNCDVEKAYTLFIASDNVKLDTTTVYQNFMDGIYILRCKPIIIDSYIEDNYNYGIYIESVSDYALNNIQFYGNYRGVYLYNCNRISFTFCIIENSNLEGIYSVGSTFELDKCDILDNYRGIYAVAGSVVRITDTYIENNGDGIYADSSRVFVLFDCDLWGNNVGIACYNGSLVRVNESYMENYYGLEFYIWKDSNAFTLNTYIDGSSYIEDTSMLTVNWSLVVGVVNATDVPVVGAKVTVTDLKSASQTNYTGLSGYTPMFECTEYIQTVSGVAFRTPHFVEMTYGIVRHIYIYMDQPENITIQTNHAPYIDSIPVMSAVQGQPYVYQVKAHDDDGDNLTYSIKTTPPSTIPIDSMTGLILWVPTNQDVGVFLIEVTVNDSAVEDKQQYYLTVDNINDNPTINDIDNTIISPGDPWIGTFTVNDPDIKWGDNVNVSLVTGPEGMLLLQKGNDMINNKVSCELYWTPIVDGNYIVIVKAVDLSGATAIRTFMLGSTGNHVPYVGSVNIAPDSGTVDTQFTAVVIGAGDFDGEIPILKYQWQYYTGTNWSDIIGANKVTYKPIDQKKGTMIKVVVIPKDAKVEGTPVASEPITLINSPPRVKSVILSPLAPTVETNITAKAEVDDSDKQDISTLSIEYVWLKNGVVIIGATSANLPPVFFAKGDTITVIVTVFDGTDRSTNFTSEAVIIGNTAPNLTGGSVMPANGDEKSDFVFTVTYQDPDGDEPGSIAVIIGSTSYAMTKRSGSPVSGAVYEYRTTLSSGEYIYHFEANDGSADAIPTPTLTLKVSSAPFDWFWTIAVAVIILLIILILVVDYMMRKPKIEHPKPSKPSSENDDEDDAQTDDKDDEKDKSDKSGDDDKVEHEKNREEKDDKSIKPDDDEEPEYDIKLKKVIQ